MQNEQPSFQPDGHLEDRVFTFLEKRPGTENIDKITLTPHQRASEKADFFLNDRAFICEVKKLQSDTKDKIERLLKPIMADEQAPWFFGQWPLEKILRHFPNGEEIRKEVFDAITSAVQTFVRKANRQIRTTKEVFGLPRAGGILIVVNDLVEVLSPEVLSFKIGELFRKRTPDGQFQFTHIEGVWILSETHVIEVSLGRKAIPAVTMVRTEDSAVAKLIDALPRDWAQFHGMPFLEMSPDLNGTVKFEKATAPVEKKETLKRSQIWEQQYRQRPYLRRHTEEELKPYFELVMRGMTPGLLKGATAQDRELTHKVLERWTHLLQEIAERGIDMRSFSPGMKAMGAKIEGGEWPRTTLAEIEAAGTKPETVEVGRYYTNSLAKNYRCIDLNGESATLVLFDQLLGKSLEVVMGIKKHNWPHYWPLLDKQLIKALDRRFETFNARTPAVSRGSSH